MLNVSQLSKHFGSVKAVDHISFQLKDGEILGLIGRNGSGKTTLFRLILGFLQSEGHGRIEWNGQDMSEQIYNVIGYLPEERGIYEKMTIEEQIVYFGELRGMAKKEVKDRIDEWMERFQVKGNKKDKIKTLSKGNQQKVQLISTLIHEPKLVILDEPFSGLDPVNADLLKNGIFYLRDKGSAIIFSSHNMDNVQQLCDRLMMIHEGERVLYGDVEEVRNSFGRTRIDLQTPDWSEASLQALDGVIEVKAFPGHRYTLILEDESYGQSIFDHVTHGKYIQMFSQQAPSLETIFKMKAGDGHE